MKTRTHALRITRDLACFYNRGMRRNHAKILHMRFPTQVRCSLHLS